MYPQDSLQGLMGKHNLQLILQSATQSHDVAKSKVPLHLPEYNIHALACCLGFQCFCNAFVHWQGKKGLTNAFQLVMYISNLCSSCNTLLEHGVWVHYCLSLVRA